MSFFVLAARLSVMKVYLLFSQLFIYSIFRFGVFFYIFFIVSVITIRINSFTNHVGSKETYKANIDSLWASISSHYFSKFAMMKYFLVCQIAEAKPWVSVELNHEIFLQNTAKTNTCVVLTRITITFLNQTFL